MDTNIHLLSFLSLQPEDAQPQKPALLRRRRPGRRRGLQPRRPRLADDEVGRVGPVPRHVAAVYLLGRIQRECRAVAVVVVGVAVLDEPCCVRLARRRVPAEPDLLGTVSSNCFFFLGGGGVSLTPLRVLVPLLYGWFATCAGEPIEMAATTALPYWVARGAVLGEMSDDVPHSTSPTTSAPCE